MNLEEVLAISIAISAITSKHTVSHVDLQCQWNTINTKLK